MTRWVSTAAGQHLAGRRKRDTVPEIVLRRELHARGSRFRLQRRLGPRCTADVVLPRHRLAIFIDGCFWHGCPQHGRRLPWTGPNAQLWEEKLARTASRDVAATRLAQEQGWTVVRVWECAVAADPTGVAEQVLATAGNLKAVVIGPAVRDKRQISTAGGT